MCSTQITASDRAAGVTTPPWRVVSVQAIPSWQLLVRFADGSGGVVDVSRLVTSEEAGVFAALRDPEVFAAVHVQSGAVTWPGELDLAPDAMYAAIKAHGNCALTAEGSFQ